MNTVESTPGDAPSPTPSSAPPFSWAAADGSLQSGWMDRLPEELRGNASLRTIGSVPDLAKSYVETKKLIGTKLSAPGENATPEQIANWRRTVGAPDRPEGYVGETGTLRPDSVPESLWNPEGEKQFLALAHKHSLPPGAVKEILAFYGDNVAQGLQSSQQQEAATLQSEGQKLRQAWGQDYDMNLHTAARVAQTAGLDPQTNPIFAHAEVVQAFARIGRLMSEDKLVRGDTTSISGSLRDKIQEITDPGSRTSLAREYRGELGPERQFAAQQQLHQLMQATSAA